MAQPTCSLVALRQLSVTKPVLVGALLCSLVMCWDLRSSGLPPRLEFPARGTRAVEASFLSLALDLLGRLSKAIGTSVSEQQEGGERWRKNTVAKKAARLRASST